jgi:hypothetical protein
MFGIIVKIYVRFVNLIHFLIKKLHQENLMSFSKWVGITLCSTNLLCGIRRERAMPSKVAERGLA